MVEYDPWSIEEKWQRRWKESGTFESEPDTDREPYFVNFPYPYMNGYLHIGHTFTLLQLQRAVEAEDFEHAAVIRDQIRELEAAIDA